MIQVPVTLLILVLASVDPRPYVFPILVTNSILGLVYMITQQEILEQKGSKILGKRMPLNMCLNMFVNISTHILLPTMLIQRVKWGAGFQVAYTAACEILGLLLVDVRAVYPTNYKKTLECIIIMHILLVVIISCWLKSRTVSLANKT